MVFLPAPRFTVASGIRLIQEKKGYTTASALSVSIDLPATRSDVFTLAWLVGDWEDGIASPTISSGWTALETHAQLGDEPRYRCAYKINSGTTALIESVSTTRNVAYIIRSYVGVDVNDPFSASSEEVNLTTGGLPDPPALTPDTNNSRIIIMGATSDTTLDTGWGAPSGYGDLSVQSANESSSSNVVIMMAEKTLETAALENPGTFTNASISTGSRAAVTVALKPAS